MSSIIGEYLKVSIFGQSHGQAIGCLMDNLPPGEKIDLDELQVFLDRRAPGKSSLVTKRKEADQVQIISGLKGQITCGAPLAALIFNQDIKSSDYDNLLDLIRPSHADYPAQVRYDGHNDIRGGGHFSGRLTAPICIAGGIAKQILKRRGIHIGAHLQAIGRAQDQTYQSVGLLEEELYRPLDFRLPVLDEETIPKMEEEIQRVQENKDSIGGIIECGIIGLPPGIGDPIFSGMENRLAGAIFGVPGIRGIEFGSGFESAKFTGSKHNDLYFIADNNIETKTNHHGGILGGITTGMPLIFRVAVKPTPSIGQAQQTVNQSRMEEGTLKINGRHDPCIAIRAVPVIEAVAAIVILDSLLISKGYRL